MKTLIFFLAFFLAALSVNAQQPPPINASYDADHIIGDTIYFSAHPVRGWRFVGWYKNDVLLSTQQYNFMYIVSEDAHLIARVEAIRFRIRGSIFPFGRGGVTGSNVPVVVGGGGGAGR